MDITKYIGIPYEEKDCWELAVDFYREHMGLELKHYYGDVRPDREQSKSLIYSNMGEFEKVDTPKLGDILLMKIRGIESHIGVFVGCGRFLHTSKSMGSHLERVDKWKKCIVGFYRHKEISK